MDPWLCVGPSAPTVNYDFNSALAAELFDIVETADSGLLKEWIEQTKAIYPANIILKWINWQNPTKVSLGETWC